MTEKTISIILSLVCFIIVFIVGLFTSILREEHRPARPFAPFSFSRVQLWLWTLIIIPLFVLHWGYYSERKVEINTTSLILLSISGAVTLTSMVITSVLLSAAKAGMMFKVNKASVNFFYDILTDENGQFSIARLQNLVFTQVFAVMYITYFFNHGKEFIDFEPLVFTLMGISSGTYIFGKALRK